MPRDFDPTVDYYEILQVHPKAQPEMIKRAYRLLLREMKAHPDLGGSHQQAVLINAAYAVLSDPARRAAYDLARETAAGQPPPPPPRPDAPPAYQAAAAIVACRTCGRKNRIPAGVSLTRARCGACGTSLAAPHTRPRPAAGDNRLRLPQALYNELVANSQLVLRVDRLRRGGRITCRKCRQPWFAGRGEPVPARCPACGDKQWNALRLFKCSQCGHEFRCNSLQAYPYLVYPRCPACQSPKWNKTCERGPLRRFLSLFFK